jgi:hypothetical protein
MKKGFASPHCNISMLDVVILGAQRIEKHFDKCLSNTENHCLGKHVFESYSFFLNATIFSLLSEHIKLYVNFSFVEPCTAVPMIFRMQTFMK